MTELQRLAIEHQAASERRREFADARKAARERIMRAAERIVEAELTRIYGPAVEHAYRAEGEARRALLAEQERSALAGEGAPAPLGTIFHQWERPYKRWSDPDKTPNPYRRTGKTGRLEAITLTSAHPQNTHREAPVGAYVLRTIKKDGTAGTSYETLSTYKGVHIPDGWHADGIDPNTPAPVAGSESTLQEVAQ